MFLNRSVLLLNIKNKLRCVSISYKTAKNKDQKFWPAVFTHYELQLIFICMFFIDYDPNHPFSIRIKKHFYQSKISDEEQEALLDSLVELIDVANLFFTKNEFIKCHETNRANPGLTDVRFHIPVFGSTSYDILKIIKTAGTNDWFKTVVPSSRIFFNSDVQSWFFICYFNLINVAEYDKTRLISYYDATLSKKIFEWRHVWLLKSFILATQFDSPANFKKITDILIEEYEICGVFKEYPELKNFYKGIYVQLCNLRFSFQHLIYVYRKRNAKYNN